MRTCKNKNCTVKDCRFVNEGGPYCWRAADNCEKRPEFELPETIEKAVEIID